MTLEAEILHQLKLASGSVPPSHLARQVGYPERVVRYAASQLLAKKELVWDQEAQGYRLPQTSSSQGCPFLEWRRNPSHGKIACCKIFANRLGGLPLILSLERAAKCQTRGDCTYRRLHTK